MIQGSDLALRDRGSTSLTLPAPDRVRLAADATGDHGMDGLDGAADIGAVGVWAGDALGAEPFPGAAPTASGFPGSDLDQVGRGRRYPARTLRAIIRCSGVPLPADFGDLLDLGLYAARPYEQEQLQSDKDEQNDENRGRDDSEGGWVVLATDDIRADFRLLTGSRDAVH